MTKGRQTGRTPPRWMRSGDSGGCSARSMTAASCVAGETRSPLPLRASSPSSWAMPSIGRSVLLVDSTLFEALHDDAATTDPALWRTNLEAVFDVDGFLKYLAVNGIIQNWDTYGRMTHNYYLYNNPEASQLTWIPWDNNEALVEGKMGGALDLDFSDLQSGTWPLIEKVYADEVYRAQYDQYVAEVIAGSFETSQMQDLYDTYAALIEPYATTELPGYSFLESAGDFDTAIEMLNNHAEDRADAVSAYLGHQ
ncbi:MAG: hypothetical protein GY713_08345 [Actinomycetia bacterium]|nr:hypothetical protein [Actinomycetes bacterium]